MVQFNSKGICVVKWKERREILAISSEYNANMQSITAQRGQEKEKHALINKYNAFMAGADHCDQMLSYYSCEKLAIHIFLSMLLTSFYLFKKGNPTNKKTFYDYRLSIIEKLLGPPPPEPLPKLKITHLPEHIVLKVKGPMQESNADDVRFAGKK